jgi:hypothetical protein
MASWSLANSISDKHGCSEMGTRWLLKKKKKKINKHPQKKNNQFKICVEIISSIINA